ncbi:protein phosphatase 2A, regulatory subunit PR55 [Actinidia rufa]|uniref:Serine/threonine-protein phosphatase 2A 55 kDa regulatory subunit B n=1 Tax=Actinidia rufa TaxID=165716 RepID=A0A7J0FG33_9ERIC|nr:protein phosphatase 2A, regulatory subunit PR55 [Actinidia rufa]
MNGADDGGEVVDAPPSPPPPLEWKFSQVFGERSAGEEVQEVAAKIPNLLALNVAFNVAVDIISAIEFDKTGDHLATGDRGGRVVLFERTDTKDVHIQSSVIKTEFQSHEPEFDYLKSLEIEEKINKIRWCQTANGALFLLSTNDKTIKFWKVQEKKVKKVSDMNMDASKAVLEMVVLPVQVSLLAPDQVITSAEFHPTHCNVLAYSSSKGSIRLIDLRQSALCDTHSKLFEEQEAPGSRSFFTEIIASISDIKFGKDGRFILSRDYMTLKSAALGLDYWFDFSMQCYGISIWIQVQFATFQVHEYLRPKLCDLYENDSIFDKFECCLSGDGQRVATGAESPGVDANGNSYDFTTKVAPPSMAPNRKLDRLCRCK